MAKLKNIVRMLRVEYPQERSILNGMKRLIPVLAVALLIPQFALAAWWNPFSWKIFKRANTETQILENRIVELEQKLEEVSSRLSTSTDTTLKEKSVQKKVGDSTVKSTPTTIVNTRTIPVVGQKLEESSYEDLVKKYADFQALIETEKSLTKKNSDLETEREYYKYIDELLTKIKADLSYLSQVKYYSPRPAGISAIYTSKYSQLSKEYWEKNKNYAINRPADEIEVAKRTVISYIIDNKNQLYLSEIHIKTSALLDYYDKLANTKYGEKFKLAKTQVETIEFANSFLIDVGEKITN